MNAPETLAHIVMAVIVVWILLILVFAAIEMYREGRRAVREARPAYERHRVTPPRDREAA